MAPRVAGSGRQTADGGEEIGEFHRVEPPFGPHAAADIHPIGLHLPDRVQDIAGT